MYTHTNMYALISFEFSALIKLVFLRLQVTRVH